MSRSVGRLGVWICLGLNLFLASGAGAATYLPVDLSRFVVSTNGPQSDSWGALPIGSKTIEGVPFRIDGRVEVTGMQAARRGDFVPSKAGPFPIERKCSSLVLLHGASNDEYDGAPLAQLVLRYANGLERVVRVAYGVQVRNWMPVRGDNTNALADLNSKVVWMGTNDDPDRVALAPRLYRTVIPNPLPDETISSVEIVSLFSRASPFIAAMTLEVDGPRPSLTTPPPVGRLWRKAHEFDEATYRRQFVVNVLDASSGSPLTNATASLTVTDDEFSFYFGEGVTDARGRIVLDYPPQHAVAYGLLVKAPGRLPLAITDSKLKSPQFEHERTVRLERGVSVGGIVRNNAGEPLAGAEVVIFKVTQDAPRQYTRIDYDAIKTDARGRWTSTAMPKDVSGFSFQVSHPENRAVLFTDGSTQGGANVLDPEVLLAGNANMVLPPANRSRGLVSDAEGRPVPGAEIYFQAQNRSAPRRVAVTDPAGKFAFADNEASDGGLIILARGFGPKYQPVSLSQDAEQTAITLGNPRPLVGFVRDQYQQPIEGVTVRLESWRDTKLLSWRTLTDARGRFSWENPPEDSVLLSVTKDGHSSMRIMISASGGEQNFVLQKRSQVFGRVVDADTRQPLPEFRIIRGRAYSQFEPIRWERYNVTRGRNGQFSIQLNDYYGSEGRSQVMVEAPGYIPQASEPLLKAGWHTNDFALKKGRGIRGMIQRPSGEPIANASVMLVDKSESAYMDRPGQFQRNSSMDMVMTDVAGRFEFPPRLDAHTVLAAHPMGFAQVPTGAVATNGVVTLVPWGRVTGKVLVGDKPEAGQGVYLQTMYYRYGEDGRSGNALSLSLAAETDADGNFVFDKVPPGERKVSLRYKFRDRQSGTIPLSHGVPVMVEPGATANVVIGGAGRPVIGRVRLTTGSHEDVNWLRDVHTLNLQVAGGPSMSGLDFSGATTPEQQRQRQREIEQRQREFWTSEQGRALDRTQRNYVLLFDTNGTFRIPNVPPGDYQLQISPTDPNQDEYNYQQIGSLYQQVRIPEPPPGRPNEPFDLGALPMSIRTTTRMGGRAPAFEAATFDGKTVKLGDFAGKHVLLDFWATWAGGTRKQELTTLTNLYSSPGVSNRLVIISLNLDPQREMGANFIQANRMPWTQCYLGSEGNEVLSAFGIEGLPGNVLVDPQGRIQARNLRGTGLLNTVRRALPPSTAPRN